MNKITLIGLSTCPDDVTAAAAAAIESGAPVYLRTAKTENYGYFTKRGIQVFPLDEVYEKSRTFETLNKNLARAVIAAAKESDVCYCVDGCVAEDNSCAAIIERRKGRDVEIIGGVPRSAKVMERLKKCGAFSQCSAYSDDCAKLATPLIVFDIDNIFTAGAVKSLLTARFGDECPCTFVSRENQQEIKLYELDRLEGYDYSCCLYIDKQPLTQKCGYDYEDLMDIVRILRGENGCPWDRAQTHESIKKNLIEECYELIDAIDNKDYENMTEELGDVLLQVALHTAICEEFGESSQSEVLCGICQKLITRHTHIFGKDKAADAADALVVWEKNKNIEKGHSGADRLLSVPRALPALMRAQKLGSRAAKFNFDFRTSEQIVEKIKEEIGEVLEAANGEKSELKLEIGDLLFASVNLARYFDIDAEEALTAASDKFMNRFVKMETLIKADGKNFETLTDDEWNDYYNEVKKH